MDISVATLHIKGISPLSQSRQHGEPKLKGESHEDYDERTWRAKLNVAEIEGDRTVILPAHGVHQSIAAAAKYSKRQIPGQGKATWTAKFQAGIALLSDPALNINPESVGSIVISANADGVRGSGKRVTRRFPQILAWESRFEIHILDRSSRKTYSARWWRSPVCSSALAGFAPRKAGPTAASRSPLSDGRTIARLPHKLPRHAAHRIAPHRNATQRPGPPSPDTQYPLMGGRWVPFGTTSHRIATPRSATPRFATHRIATQRLIRREHMNLEPSIKNAIDIDAICAILRAVSVGGIVTHAKLSEAIGADATKRRWLVMAALKRLSQENGALFASVHKVGFKRLAPQDSHIIGAAARKSIKRRASNAAKKIRCAISTANDLPPEAARKANREVAMLGLIEFAATERAQAAAEPETATPKPVAQVMADMLAALR